MDLSTLTALTRVALIAFLLPLTYRWHYRTVGPFISVSLGCFLTDITRAKRESPATALVIATIVATVPLLV